MGRAILLSQQNERMVFMKAFDKIIGYVSIKQELMQISDTLKNPQFYDKLGVSAPRGLLLYGEPGGGQIPDGQRHHRGKRPAGVPLPEKTSPTETLSRRSRPPLRRLWKTRPPSCSWTTWTSSPTGTKKHPDAEEYVTVQSCIDETKGKEVFVLATANDTDCLPDSLQRAGRFDRTNAALDCPPREDAVQIIAHYLKSKRFVGRG